MVLGLHQKGVFGRTLMQSNTLYDITEWQIPHGNYLADWSHDKSIVLSRFYNECFQMDHLREIHKRGPSATCRPPSISTSSQMIETSADMKHLI